MISKINGKLFADMIIQGAHNLSNNADLVDSLMYIRYLMVIQEQI